MSQLEDKIKNRQTEIQRAWDKALEKERHLDRWQDRIQDEFIKWQKENEALIKHMRKIRQIAEDQNCLHIL